MAGPPLLEFAGIAPVPVPCYPVSQQIAEKVHAYTRTYASGESTRITDWVDILLMAELGSLNAQSLRRALQATFDARQTHALPSRMSAPLDDWEPTFRQFSREMALRAQTLRAASEAMAQFIEPVLRGELDANWEPLSWSWKRE